MKVKTRYIILCLTCVILLVAPGMLFAVEPIAVKQPITMKGLYFSKTPKSEPLMLPAELKNIPPSPVPLASQVRKNAINQIRGTFGLGTITQLVPAHVILTPDAPKSGSSYYVLYQGNNYPDPRTWSSYPGQTKPFSYFRDSASYLFFTFATIRGKTYMLDLLVGPTMNTFILSGVFTGDVKPQDNHIIIGFKANSMMSTLQLKSHLSGYNSNYFTFYRAELTQVD